MDFKGYWRDIVYFLIAKLLMRKVIFQLHGGDKPERFFRHERIPGYFRKWQLSAADAVVLLLEKEKQAAFDYCPFKRLVVIPNAIDGKEFADFTPRSFRKERFNLAYIGRLVREKGIFEAVEAFSVLQRDGIDNISLSIAGAGPAEEELKRLVHSLGLEKHVEFRGTVRGTFKTQFWREADLLVFPTYHEGLPYTLLESLAAGVPVITTHVGGIPEAVEDGVHGVFVEPRDPEALAGAIRTMLSDRERLRMMSEACIMSARKRFGIERLAAQFDELYHALMVS
jgi:glycosyltransferase involved in cell wall biosynthesis